MNRELEETSQNQENKISKEEVEKKFKLLKQHFKGQFKESYKYIDNIILKRIRVQFTFQFQKILSCFYSLQQRDQQCEVNPLFFWLTIVGMYFIPYIYSRYLAVLYFLQMNSKDIYLLVMAEMLSKDSNEQMNLQGMEERNKRNQIKTLIKMKLSSRNIRQEELIAEPPFTQCEIIHQAEALNKYTRLMKVYNQFIFYLIFTGGNIAYSNLILKIVMIIQIM